MAGRIIRGQWAGLKTKSSRHQPLLGTQVDIHVAGHASKALASAQGIALETMQRLMGAFNIFDSESDLSRFRRGAEPTTDLMHVLHMGHKWMSATSGAFNPWIEPLRELWEHAAETQTVPKEELLRTVVDAINQDKPDPAALNLNALAKGWIVDRAVSAALKAEPSLTSLWVNAGGDILHCGDSPITVGIENPRQPFDNIPPLTTVSLQNRAIATSGGSRRSWTINGCEYSHVIDPRTGHPVHSVSSATVLGQDTATADVLATAFAVLPPNGSIELANSLPSVECLVIAADNVVHTSNGWPTPPA